MNRFVACTTAAALTLVGCASTLSVQRVDPGRQASGYPYQLRYTQFEMAVTWQVVKCDPTKPKPLTIKITVTPRTINPLDPDHLYAIDPRSLQGLFRTTAFSMEWFEDRGPRAINSSVDDQSGAAIVNTLTGAARLASLGLGSPGAATVPLVSSTDACPKVVAENLLAIFGDDKATPAIKGQAAIVEEAQAAVTLQTARVTRTAARLAAAGAGADDQTRTRLGTETADLESLTAVLELEKARLKTLFEPLTATATVRWPLDGRTLALDSTPVRPTNDVLAKWNAEDSAEVNVYFALRAVDGYEMPDYVAPTTPRSVRDESRPLEERRTPVDPVTEGLPYREPRPMRLYACKVVACPNTIDLLQQSRQVVHASDVQVFQAGGMFRLPFSARTFANTTNSAGFAQSGVLVSAGTTQPRAPGTTFASTLADASTQVVAGVQADRTAETTRLQALTGELNARRAYEEAQRSLTTTADQQALAAYAAEASLATAERTAIEARIALDAARARLAGAP